MCHNYIKPKLLVKISFFACFTCCQAFWSSNCCLPRSFNFIFLIHLGLQSFVLCTMNQTFTCNLTNCASSLYMTMADQILNVISLLPSPSGLFSQLVCWCSEPSNPHWVTLGLETNVNPPPTYSEQVMKLLFFFKIHKSSLHTNIKQTIQRPNTIFF